MDGEGPLCMDKTDILSVIHICKVTLIGKISNDMVWMIVDLACFLGNGRWNGEERWDKVIGVYRNTLSFPSKSRDPIV